MPPSLKLKFTTIRAARAFYKTRRMFPHARTVWCIRHSGHSNDIHLREIALPSFGVSIKFKVQKSGVMA